MTKNPLLVFDFDGTLVDAHTVYAEALREFSEARGLPHCIDKMGLGYTTPQHSDLGWGIPLEQQQVLLDELNNFYFDEIVNNNRFIPILFPQVIETLDILSQDYDLSVVTARNRKSFEAIVKFYDLGKYFPHYRTLCCVLDRGQQIKPAPDALNCLLRDTQHAPDNVVVIGDTTADIGMAHAAGTKSIAALWGVHPREKLAATNPTIMLESIQELPQALDALFTRQSGFAPSSPQAA